MSWEKMNEKNKIICQLICLFLDDYERVAI